MAQVLPGCPLEAEVNAVIQGIRGYDDHLARRDTCDRTVVSDREVEVRRHPGSVRQALIQPLDEIKLAYVPDPLAVHQAIL
jgi:uncharacterized protein (UPF0218 family)